MYKKQLAILTIVCVAFALGGVLGFLYENQIGSRQIKLAVSSLSSKAVSSISLRGQVEKIDGRNITINNSGDSVTVKIQDNASVSSSAPFAGPQGGFAFSQNTAGIEDIKIGDSLNLSLKLLPSGQMEGLSVVIFKKL